MGLIAPRYFERVRTSAAQRWVQLERDADLAAPWHQLFKQVQSPRHVLSELLQNADDAGASEAAVRIEDHRFIFTHDGEDFTEDHFASLCRFGYSNKRALHTIGFRGIGFKSTFSLGDTVELRTRTLSVAFDRRRFTEPRWIATTTNLSCTEVSVAMPELRREREVQKNLEEWLTSPVSLLFFENIRRLRIGDREMSWESLGPGPVPGTEWMALNGDPEQAYLVAASEPEAFPEEALAEIRGERLLGDDEKGKEFPPSRVEIVLGAPGRLFVVLPTGVETALPFACNAPFVQDPARMKIKEPETSPTNRWLLERLGKLASVVMHEWLGNPKESIVERARAYALLPAVDTDDTSLEGACSATVTSSFDEQLEGEAWVLSETGSLHEAGDCFAVESALMDVWPADQISAHLDEQQRAVLSRQISADDRQKLIDRRAIEFLSQFTLLAVLRAKHLPRPKTWKALLKLWSYLSAELTSYRTHAFRRDVRIVPVQGGDVLYSANEVVRLGEKRLLQSESDWEFLSEHLLVLNQNWPRFLAEARRSEGGGGDPDEAAAALAVLKILGLEESSDADEVLERVTAGFFTNPSIPIAKCVQIAQIAAKLGADVSNAMRFVTRDAQLREPKAGLVYDPTGSVSAIVSDAWGQRHLLHPQYFTTYTACTSDEWKRWADSERSGLAGFVPLVRTTPSLFSRAKAEAEVRRRGFTGGVSFPYVTNQFQVDDWDFEGEVWKHWESLARDNPAIWTEIAERILTQSTSYWSPATRARVLQVATTRNAKAITSEPLLPNWILRLRELPCLPDTRGAPTTPRDLLRRTPATEPFMDVEPFVHGRLDTEATRPLLAFLRVRDTPTNPTQLLTYLRALGTSSNPPATEVDKWYRRLDQMVDACSTSEREAILRALREERLILVDGGGWAAHTGVFLSADDDDAPGAPLIRSSVRELSLWRKLGIAERPSVELAIAWLKTIPTGRQLSREDERRVRGLQTRHARRIWEECGHWISLSRDWTPVRELEFGLTMQSLIEWSHLHDSVKRKVADLTKLPVDVTSTAPFAELPLLATSIKDHVDRPNGNHRSQPVPWLTRFCTAMMRVELETEHETARVRDLSGRLAHVGWVELPGLAVVPYIAGIPVGTARPADVVWVGDLIFVDHLTPGRLARVVPERIGKLFARSDITAALSYCFDRADSDVLAYVEENFKLAAETAVNVAQAEPASESTTELAVNASPGVQIETGLGESLVAVQKTASHVPIGIADAPSDEHVPGTRKPDHHRPAKQPLIERFAIAHGFKKDSDNRFFRADGNWIGRVGDSVFPWEQHDANGVVVRHYWPKDHCLEREALQLDAEVWNLVDKFPASHALLLTSPDGNPREVLGAELRAMRDDGELSFFPATYRLALAYDGNR